MAFLKRTWLARIGTGLNKFIIGNKDGEGKQTLTNAPDSVTQQGDVISAENLNDLEDRIEAGFNEKQDVLTFDSTPTQGSNNPVTSGGLYDAIPDFYFNETSISFTLGSTSDGRHSISLTIPSVTGYTCVGIMGWVLIMDVPGSTDSSFYYPLGAIRLNSTTIKVYFYTTSIVGGIEGTLSTTLCYKKN